MIDLKIRCDVELPKGFKKFYCTICEQTIIMAHSYVAFNTIEYTHEDILWCPICRSDIKGDRS